MNEAVVKVLGALDSTGCGPKAVGPGKWSARCPAHEDRRASLSVGLGEGGRALLKCFAGCTFEAVRDALGLVDGDFFAPKATAPAPARTRKSGAVTRYEIRDVGGAVVAIHCRKDGPDGKRLWWQTPDGRRGLDGLKMTALPLFGCERLAALPLDAEVVVCEGEKAAQALIGRGMPTVGTVTGAAGTPGAEALRPLLRFRLILWPDNDEPGRGHMHRIGAALRALGHTAVRVLTWADAPPAGDAADFGDDDGALRALLASAEPFADGEAVDAEELLAQVAAFIRRFVVLGHHETVATLLWVVHTHVFGAADATPYLQVTSAEKRSGKSRLLEVLALLVRRPWLTARVSPAVLMRKIERDAPSLLLDESDAAFGGDREYAEALRGLLNAGWRVGGAASVCVKRGADFELKDFAVFCPKALAGLGRLPDTLGDRSIRIELRRRTPDEAVSRFRRREADALAKPVRERCEAWSAGALDRLRAATPNIPDDLGDRAAEGWEPLLAIADLAGGDWPDLARGAAVALAANDPEDDSLGVRLLADVRAVFDEHGADRLSSCELVAGLVARDEAPWADIRGKPIDARRLARMLRPYGIRPVKWGSGRASTRGYLKADFADAWARYVHTPGLSAASAACAADPLGGPEKADFMRRMRSSPSAAESCEPPPTPAVDDSIPF